MRKLIKAGKFGVAAVTGDSFRNTVPGAGSGADVNDYKVFGFNSFTGDVPDIAEGIKASGYQWVFGWSVVRAALFGNIQANGNFVVGVRRTDSAVYHYAGQALNVLAQNMSGASATMTLEVLGGYKEITTVSGHAWYTGYVEPANPGGTDVAEVSFTATVSYGPGGLDTQDIEFELHWTPDYGGDGDDNHGFNIEVTYPGLSARTTQRYEPSSNVEIEWHTNSSYTALYTTGVGFTIFSWPQQDNTYWMRWRRGSGAWTNYGAVNWHDNR